MVLVLGTPWVASLGIGCMGYWVLALIKVAMGHSFGSWLLCVAGFWMLGHRGSRLWVVGVLMILVWVL